MEWFKKAWEWFKKRTMFEKIGIVFLGLMFILTLPMLMDQDTKEPTSQGVASSQEVAPSCHFNLSKLKEHAYDHVLKCMEDSTKLSSFTYTYCTPKTQVFSEDGKWELMAIGYGKKIAHNSILNNGKLAVYADIILRATGTYQTGDSKYWGFCNWYGNDDAFKSDTWDFTQDNNRASKTVNKGFYWKFRSFMHTDKAFGIKDAQNQWFSTTVNVDLFRDT